MHVPDNAAYLQLGAPQAFGGVSSSVLSYSAAGGPAGNGHVTFNRAESDFLSAGMRKLNISSNGGFTVVTVVRFTGSPGSWERIIDFGNGANDNNLVLARRNAESTLELHAYNAGSHDLWLNSPSGTIAQDTWHTIIARYDASTLEAELRVDGAVVGTATASAAIADRTVSNTYVGKSNGPNIYLNADMAGLLVADQYLDLNTAVSHVHAMKAGTYSAGGASTCTSCPSTSSSPAGSGYLGDCFCNAGYTGLGGDECVACEAGKFKNVTGSAECFPCPAGTYSDEIGVYNESRCLDCERGKWSESSGSSETSCFCDLGFTGAGTTCLACVPGKYKDTYGTSDCLSCPGNARTHAYARAG